WARSLRGFLYIDIKFVPEALRGTGIGTSLLRQAEQEAMRRGCREIWLDTHAFQARSLYEKFGFTVFGRLDGPTPIFPRFFLKKALDAKERRPGRFMPPDAPPNRRHPLPLCWRRCQER